MWRGILVIVVVATFVGAMMPAREDALGAENASAPASISSWGSGEPEIRGSSSGSTTRSRSADRQTSSGGSVRLSRQADGHFYAKVKVNNSTVDFLVDTGASGIALSMADARRANVDFNKSDFEVVGEGAAGMVMGQRVVLDSVNLGSERASNVPAVVLDGGTRSLLGQSFLERFGTVEIRGDTMTLRG